MSHKKIVLDTNVLLVSVSEKSALHWVFDSLLKKKYTICVTTDILAEYAEILDQKMGSEVSKNVLSTIENLSNVEFITTYYRFRLLQDEDDDKFVNCAIASNANYIVTHDKDFNVLAKIEFPKVQIKNTEQFRKDIFDLNE